MLAVRCYEPEMKKLDRKKSQDDSLLILQKDHIRILIRNARSGPFELAVSADGAVLDRVFDPGRFSGDCASWNSAVHRGIVRYYKDRWEVEIPFGHIGLFPDWNPAWGFRVERVRTLNGQRLTSSNCRGKTLDMGHWASLTLQKKDSKGRDMVRRDGIHLPVKGVPDGVVYCIRKAKKNVPFSAAAWNDPETWGSVPEARLGNELFFYGRSNKAGYRPEPSFKMMYDDKYLYVFYKVKDRYVRGVFKEDQQMVCLDSCMELFIMPNGKGCYFNFEANCLGTLLLYRMGPQTKRIPLEELKKIRRFHSMPRTMFGEKVGDTVWYLGLQIPLDFFVRYADVTLPLKGQVWTGNVYKCADRSSHPCWMAWRNTVTFHSVEGFGKFIFE